jgi:hypothetical protein
MAGPVGLDVKASLAAGLTAKVDAKASAKWSDAPGPRIDGAQMMTLSVSGGGDVGFDLTGTVGVGATVGPPMFRLAAGAEASLSAEAKIGVNLGGTLERLPDTPANGAVIFTLTGNADIKAAAALYVDAVGPDLTHPGKEKRYNMYTYTLGEHTLAKLSMVLMAVYDGGKVIDLPPLLVAVWQPLPPMKEVKKRPLSDEEQAAMLPVNQGASGAPASVPTETEVECDGQGGGGGFGSYCPTPDPVPNAPNAPNDGGGGAPGSSGGQEGQGGK